MSSHQHVTVNETIDLGEAPESGAHLFQVTSSDAIFDNIYSEAMFADATSRYFIFNRRESRDLHPNWGLTEVWRGDLQDLSMTLVTDEAIGICAMGVSPDQRLFYCIKKHTPDSLVVLSIDMASLEQTAVEFRGLRVERLAGRGTVTPDNRIFVVGARLGPHRHGVLRCDLQTAEWDVVHEGGDDIWNPHTQLEPGSGRDILIQQNRGARLADDGTVISGCGEEGATLYIIDIDGGNRRDLPVGRPWTWSLQGHQVWLADTGDVVFTTDWPDEDAGRREGILRRIRPGEAASEVVARGHLFDHPALSGDGRFFVTETWDPQSRIVVGSIETGNTRVLLNTGSGWSDHYSCPEPYFTPDCRWVIFSSERSGTPHVYAARVPEGLLEQLEEPGSPA